MSMPPMLGRELDLAVAVESLKRLDNGTPASLLVRGDAGIGKSRLVAELAARSRQLGHVTLLGRADDLDRGIPYALFRDLLARAGPDVAARAAELRATFEEGAAARDREGDTGDAHLAAVFAGAVQLLRDVADAGPTLLVLEDLHVADPESLALTALLVRLADVPVLTVGTLRPGAPQAGGVELLLEQMAFDGRGSVIDLEPLDRHETQAVVAAVLGAAPTEDLATAVFAASHGNPYFAGEVARSFIDGGAVMVEEGRARLVADAPTLRLRPSTALLRRVFAGTAQDVELAKVMAVFGRFSLRHLSLVARMTDRPEDDVVRSFDRLVKAGVLVETPGGGHEFSHAIVRATLYEDIGPAERRRLHRDVAAALATEQRAGILLDVLELATHVAESADPGDQAAARTLLDAGRAVAATAPLVSAGYHGRAADLLPAGSPLRTEALAGQARALHLGARTAEAAAVGRLALDALAPGEARPGTVAIVVHDLYMCGRVDEALEVVESELARGGDPCALTSQRVGLLFQAERYAEAAAGLDDALDALEGGAPASQLMAITHLSQYANHVGRVEVAEGLLDRLGDLTERESPTLRLASLEVVAFADWRPGLAARIELHLARGRELRPGAATPSVGGSFEVAQTRLHWMRGEWDDALELIQRAAFDLEQRGTLVSAALLRCHGAEMLVDRGDVDEAVAVAAAIPTPIGALRRNAELARARVDLAVGDLAAAERRLTEQRVAASTEGGSLWKLAEVLASLIDIHLENGRDAEAEVAVADLDALAERTRWPECRLPALRARARVRGDAAAGHAAAALADEEGWVVERARAALDLGELEADPAANLTAAYRWFDAFGAAPWRRRAAAGLRSRGLTVPRRAAQPGSTLTDTEVQLVRLVRDGLTNRQIATAMHYSTKTIEVYLSRLYARTGHASRLDLIRAVDTGALSLD